MEQIVLIMITWYGYSLIEGEREGYYYDSLSRVLNPPVVNLHTLFSFQRLFVLLMVYYVHSFGVVDNIFFVISLAAAFPFFHDGMYYVTRHKLNGMVYTKGFFDNSTESNAVMNFNFFWRLVLFVLSLTIQTLLVCRLLNII